MYRIKSLVYGLFVSIGVVLLLAAYILDELFTSRIPGDVAMNLGVVTLATTMLNLLWRYSGGEPIETHLVELKSLARLSAVASKLGLSDVRAQATDVSTSEWLALIQSSRTAVDISSHTLSQFLDEPYLWRALVERLSKGVKIRLLLNSPRNPALKASGSSPAAYLESRRKLMKNAWETFEAARANLPEAQRANLTVGRLTDESLFVSIRRFDDKMYVGQYLYTDNMRNNPVLVIEGSDTPLFLKYLNEFEGQLRRALTTPPPGLTLSPTPKGSVKSRPGAGAGE
jgi:hypothetical protein